MMVAASGRPPGSRGEKPRSQLWGGRFDVGPDDSLRALSDSLRFDIRLFREDIAVSRAHVRMLESVGLLSVEERDSILDALEQVEEEIGSADTPPATSDEDIHSLVERRVTEIAGVAGAKLHTGRSRNDQAVTDLRLWARTAIDQAVKSIRGLQRTLLDKAEAAGDACLPGYTHLQQAQPVALAHHLLAHGWALQRDVERLLDARARVDVSPLGAGALAGSSLPIDPELTAAELGFSSVFENSLDAVGDRDFVAETLFALALLGVHLSRLGEEFVIWSSVEFGFVELDDRFATGSSMMPQKKNPDIAELARGKAGRLIGHVSGLLATLKGLPLSYNKDLQEDKEPLFDAFDTVQAVVAALDGMIATCRFRVERMESAASSPYAAATDLAEWLVERGVPFREAHSIVARAVRISMDEGAELADVVARQDDLGPAAAELLKSGSSAGRRITPGGGAPSAVRGQMALFRAVLDATTPSVE